MTTDGEKLFRQRKTEWLKAQGFEINVATRTNETLRDALRLNSDDISDTLLTAVQGRIWEKGIGHFSDNPDRCKVNHASSMQEWVEADWGLNMTMSQLFRAVANKRMNDSAAEAATLLIEATPKDVLETVAYKSKAGTDLFSADVPGWLDIAAANQQAYGSDWGKVRDAIDDLLHRKPGGDRKSEDFKNTDSNFEKPSGNSREGRRRTLKRYADSSELCETKGVQQDDVKAALRGFEEGQLSATAAMRSCGLLAKSDSSTNRVFLVRDSKEVARRLLDATGPDRAAEIVAALSELLTS